MRLITLLALALVTACGGSTEPSRALPVGVYAYSTNTGLSGTFTITSSDDDGADATWDVRNALGEPAFRPDGNSLGWNIDAFVFFAQSASPFLGSHSHRLVRSGEGISCSGTHVGVGPFSCTMVRR
jgi:hypothetical protein